MPWHTLRPGTVTSSVSPIVLTIGELDVILVPHENGWLAVEDRCSHAGCRFSEDGEILGTSAICDCHGSEFDLRTGEPVRAPAEAPVRTFSTRVTSGSVEIYLP